MLYIVHRREDRRLTFGNTFRQLPTSHSGHPGDLCVPRLPGMNGFVDEWMELTLKNFSLNTSCNATKCWVGGDEPRPLKVSQRRWKFSFSPRSIFEFSRWMRFATHQRGRSSRRLFRTSTAPFLAPSCEATKWLLESGNSCEAIRQPYIHEPRQSWRLLRTGSLPARLCEPVLIMLYWTRLHHEAICVKPKPAESSANKPSLP